MCRIAAKTEVGDGPAQQAPGWRKRRPPFATGPLAGTGTSMSNGEERGPVTNYRMIAQVPQHQDLEARLTEQLYSWIRHKKFDADTMEPGTITDLGAAQSVWLTDDQVDGTRVMRFRLRERRGWLTTLTAELPTASRFPAQVWLEVEPPNDEEFPAVPRLARNILTCIEAYDGRALLSDRPVPLAASDIGDLIDVLCDPDRRGMAFVAGSDPGNPVQEWRSLVKAVLHDTVGAASAYLLDPAATARLQQELGERHAVPAGTIRSYRPEVDPASYVDARRHRVLGQARLEADRPRYLARLLGHAAREQQHSQPLPHHLTRLATRLARAENQMLAASTVTVATVPAAPETPVSTEVVPSIEPKPAAAAAGPADAALLPPPGYVAELTNAVQQLLGQPLTSASVQQLVTLARMGQAGEARKPPLQQRADELTDEVEQVTGERDHWFREAEDLELELALLAEHASDQDDRVQYLQRRLQEAGQAEAAWSEVPDEERRRIPDNYEQLLEWMSRLPHIVFTGDPEVTLELSQQDAVGRWARNTWDALLALEGYAQAKSDGFHGNFRNYLDSADVVGPRIAASRYVPVEGETVANKEKWRSERTFPVPAQIDHSGHVFMQAHIRIALKRTTSPRLHFCDATATDGRIYVGYIGKHLTNTQS